MVEGKILSGDWRGDLFQATLESATQAASVIPKLRAVQVSWFWGLFLGHYEQRGSMEQCMAGPHQPACYREDSDTPTLTPSCSTPQYIAPLLLRPSIQSAADCWPRAAAAARLERGGLAQGWKPPGGGHRRALAGSSRVGVPAQSLGAGGVNACESPCRCAVCACHAGVLHPCATTRTNACESQDSVQMKGAIQAPCDALDMAALASID